MKSYLELAKFYFESLEGIRFYPSWRNWQLWVWVLTTILWGYSIVLVGIGARSIVHPYEFVQLAIFEVIWLACTFYISDLKDKQVILQLNAKLNSNIEKIHQCKEKLLADIFKDGPKEYLRIAKEIETLVKLKKDFKKKSDFSWEEMRKIVYDKDSKARLLTLFVALLSMTVALTVKTSVSLDTMFDAVSDPGWRKLMVIFITFSVALFFATSMLGLMALSFVDLYVSWAIRIFRGAVFEEWLLAYLVRDLIYFYKTQDNGVTTNL